MKHLQLGLWVVAAVGCTACADNAPVITEFRPSITSVRSSTPMVEGTGLRVSVSNIDSVGPTPLLEVSSGAGSAFLLEASSVAPGVATFPLSGTLVRALGSGTRPVQLVLSGEGFESDPYDFALSLAESLPVSLSRAPGGSVYRNDLLVMEGEGFLEAGEGTLVALFRGTFVGDETTEVDAEIPVFQAEPGDRGRGAVALTTAIGGPRPGTFDGTVELRSSPLSGSSSQSDALSIRLDFQPPVFFEATPTEAALEGIVTVRGGGFLGGADDEVTLIRIEGMFEPDDGAARTIGPEELVFDWRSGSELAWTIRSEERDEQLTSVLFGARSGRFRGSFTPVAIRGTVEVEGGSGPIDLRLVGLRQVVFLKFLPGFYSALPRFGVAAAAGRLEQLAAERIESIYARWNIDVRLESPRDVSPNGYAIVEVGGPDPNGIGLFGYDNTPDKDVGNLRLGDRIGGENAATQASGLPGYGGVFIEGFLGWSSTAEIEGAGPDPDILFDEIFAGVRTTPATLAEVQGTGDRATEVDRAVRALASLVGETSAHELGHSMGLADPFGSRTVFHNRGDTSGCLMDSGGARPFGERSDQIGFAETTLCGENAEYLDEIFGIE